MDFNNALLIAATVAMVGIVGMVTYHNTHPTAAPVYWEPVTKDPYYGAQFEVHGHAAMQACLFDEEWRSLYSQKEECIGRFCHDACLEENNHNCPDFCYSSGLKELSNRVRI